MLAGECLAIALTGVVLGRLADRTGRTRVILVCGASPPRARGPDGGDPGGRAGRAAGRHRGALRRRRSRPSQLRCARSGAGSCPRSGSRAPTPSTPIQLEVVFIVGPLIAAGLATALTPAVGLILCAGLYLMAATGFATAPRVRSALPEHRRLLARARARSRLQASGLSSPSASSPRFPSAPSRWRCPRSASSEGSRAAAGPLLTLWALGSVLGGLWYGSRTWRAPPSGACDRCSRLLALGTAPLVSRGHPGMALLLVLTGLALAPLATTAVRAHRPPRSGRDVHRGLLVAHRRDRRRLLARGRGRGPLVERASVPWALASAALACAAGFLLALLRARTLSAEAESRPLRGAPAPRRGC